MKTFILTFVLACSVSVVACAGDTNITRQIRPRKDGVLETVRRGTNVVMQIFREGGTNAPGRIIFRMFYVGGKAVIGETDNDKDGFLEGLMVWNSDRQVELFTRHKDGTVEPVSTQELERFNKSTALTREFMRGIMKEGKMDLKKLERHREDIRRIEEGESKAEGDSGGKAPNGNRL